LHEKIEDGMFLQGKTVRRVVSAGNPKITLKKDLESNCLACSPGTYVFD